jgi:TP901 family phage tail tape measure protein
MSANRVKQGNVYVEIGADPRKFFAAIDRVNRRIGSLGAQMANVGARVSAAAGGIAIPMGMAVARFAQFDDAIRATAAVTGSFGEKGAAAFQSMNDRARELGATTSFTAVEVANLMTELGRAGFSPDEINSMTGAVLDLARATGTDATLSAGIMSSALRQFSLGAGDATRVSDILTISANSTFNTVEALGEALSYAGISAAQAGMSIEETAAILGVLGNVGVQGSMAGTSLRRIVNVSAAEAARLQEIFGVDFLDDTGNVRNLIEIFRDLGAATNDLPSGERIAKFNDAFGLLGITGAQALGGAIGDVDALTAKMEAGRGAAARTAQEMDKGLGGAMRILLSAVEGTALAIGNALAPSLQSIVAGVTAAAGGLTKFIQANGELIVSASAAIGAVAGIGAALVAAGLSLQVLAFSLGGIAGAAKLALAPIGLIASAASTAGSAFASAVPGVLALAGAAGTALVGAAQSAAGAAASTASAAAGMVASLRGVAASAVAAGSQFAAAMAGQFAAGAGVAAGAAGRLGAAIASDLAPAAGRVAGLFAPITAAVSRGGAAVAAFATDAAGSLAHYGRLVAAAVAGTVGGMAQTVAAYVAAKTAGAVAFASESAAALAHYARMVGLAVAGTVAGAGRIAGAYVASAMPATAAFVAQSVAALAGYVSGVVAAAAATVTNAAAIGVAWVSAGLPGLAAFVGSALAGIGSYVVAVGGAAAATVASMATVVAAFAAPLAPFLALGVAVGAIAGVAYQFRDGISGAFAGLGELASSAGVALGETFAGAAANAMVVLSDLGSIAGTTFRGIYDAIADGDLAGAMDVLWLGLNAGWLRGVEALMGAVDPWVSGLQNTFTYLVANVLSVWDQLANGISSIWDNLEATIRKSWNYIQSFFKGGQFLAEENAKVDSEMSARARERELRTTDRFADADQIAAGREEENRRRAEQNRANTQAAESKLGEATAGKRETRARNDQYAALLKDIENASTMDQLRDAYGEFDALQSGGRLTEGQAQSLETALDDAQNRVTLAESAANSAKALKAGAGAAGDRGVNQSSSETAGTFSAMAVAGMGLGSTLAERTAKAAEETANNTKKIANQQGVKVGE